MTIDFDVEARAIAQELFDNCFELEFDSGGEVFVDMMAKRIATHLRSTVTRVVESYNLIYKETP